MEMNINLAFCILLCMIFLHILDDFVLQSFTLSKLKQKNIWEKYVEGKDKRLKELYKNDYWCALIIHSVSWSIAIVLPWIFMYPSKLGGCIAIFVVLNTIVHADIDNTKANKEKINLITDQCIHLIQIILTWGVLVNLSQLL